MDHRQRGVAHVNIFWCLVPLVLMFGAAGYGYMKHVEADEAKIDARQAKSARVEIEHKFNERERHLSMLTEMLGSPGTFLPPIEEREGYKPPENYTTPAKLKIAFGSFAGKINSPASLTTLSGLLGAAESELRKHTDLIANLERQLNDSRSERDSSRASLASVQAAKDGEIRTLEAGLASERTKMDRQVADSSAQLADARQKTREATAAKEAAVKDANQKLSAKDKEILGLEAANLAKSNRLKLINSPQEPDGLVLSSSPRTGTAWINIGAKDMVKVGLTLRVLEPVLNGGYRIKGQAYVTDVEHDRARIKVTSLANKLDPVVRNDLVANDLYSPLLKRNVFLLGRFATPYNKGEIKRILENMGNTVSDVMDPTVDLVILGRQMVGEDATKLEDTDEFRKAAAWNIEFAPLNKIRDFLKL